MAASTAHQDRRNRLAIFAGAALLSLAVALGLSACDSTDDGASQAELRETAIAYVDALVAGSPERACRYVAPPPGRDEQAWQQQCEKIFERELESSEAEAPRAGEVGEVSVTGTDGLVGVTFRIEGMSFEDQLRFRFQGGAWLLVLRRQP